MDGKNDTLTRVHPESGLSVLGTNIPPLRSPFAISAVKPQLCLCFQFRLAEPSIYTGKQTASPLCHRRHALLHLVALALYAHSLDCAPLSALQVLARLNCGHASASHKAPEAELRVRPATAAAKEPIGGSEAVFSRRHGHRRQVHSFCGATEHRTTWCWHCFCWCVASPFLTHSNGSFFFFTCTHSLILHIYWNLCWAYLSFLWVIC
jgi:hypothetical protein